MSFLTVNLFLRFRNYFTIQISKCNVLVYYDIVSDSQEIERNSHLFTIYETPSLCYFLYASLAAPVNQINVFVIVTSPNNIVTQSERYIGLYRENTCMQ